MTTMPQPTDLTTSFTATYDAWNRLVTLVNRTTTYTIATYQYDGAKRRVIEQTYTTDALDETRHCYFTAPSKWQVIEERLDSSSTAVKQFVWGRRYIDDIVLRDRDLSENGTLDERLYGLHDANWNVTCLINFSGNEQERVAYSAYGVPIFLNSTFLRQSRSYSKWETLHAGYRWNELDGLYNTRNRSYQPEEGIWTQRDPVGLTNGVNLYLYVLNNPILFTDPEGLWPPGGVAPSMPYYPPAPKPEPKSQHKSVPGFAVQCNGLYGVGGTLIQHCEIVENCTEGTRTEPDGTKMQYRCTPIWIDRSRIRALDDGTSCSVATRSDIRACLKRNPHGRAMSSTWGDNCQSDTIDTLADCCMQSSWVPNSLAGPLRPCISWKTETHYNPYTGCTTRRVCVKRMPRWQYARPHSPCSPSWEIK